MALQKTERPEVSARLTGTRIRREARVLLVDDSAENLVSLEAALEGLDAQMVTARSRKYDLRHLLESDYPAIILDVQNAGTCGWFSDSGK